MGGVDLVMVDGLAVGSEHACVVLDDGSVKVRWEGIGRDREGEVKEHGGAGAATVPWSCAAGSEKGMR